MEGRFAGQVALVTGADGGIGSAVARRLAREGAHVVATARRAAARLARAWQEHGLPPAALTTLEVDVADEDAVAAAVQRTLGRHERLDVVVNAAGTMPVKPLAELSLDDWNATLRVDLLAPFLFIREMLRHAAPGGAVVNVASIHADAVEPGAAAYAAARAALVSLTRSAALEGRPRRLRVNALLPGAVDTPMLRENPNVQSGAEHVEPAELGTPDDVAAAVAFLASREAAFINGAAVTIDGGRMTHL